MRKCKTSIILLGIIVFSSQLLACPKTQLMCQQQAMVQGGILAPIQQMQCQQLCIQEVMYNPSSYQTPQNSPGNISDSSGNCNAGLYQGQNVHPDRCLGGILAEKLIGLF